jgi:hypothetical protein
MKHLIILAALAGAMAHGQTVTLTDTIRTPMGGNWAGTVTVTLNNPQTAQPLYSGNETLSGWSQTVSVVDGAFSLTLYTNDQITPGGTSYTARYSPTSGAGWSETWVVPAGATTIREVRSTTVPTPRTMFTPAQITQGGATLGQALRWNGAAWAPGTFVADPMTATGDLITRSGGVASRVPIGTTGQVLTVAGGLPTWASGISGNAATATALAANGTNCAAGTFPLGVDASGNSEGCTALPTTITGTAGQITASAATGPVTLSLPSAITGLTSVTATTFTGALTGNASTATALASNPTDCSAGQFATTIAANGDLTCAAVTLANVSGAIGGAASVATGQVLFGTGAGVAGTSANLFWDAANNRLGVGTNTPQNTLHITTGGSTTLRLETTVASNAAIEVRRSSSVVGYFGSVSGSTGMWTSNPTGLPGVGIHNATGNIFIAPPGATDDGVNRLQVAGSARIALSAAQSGLQVVNTTTFSSMDIIGATEANIALQDTGALTNQQVFNLNVNDGALLFRVLNDARTGVNGVFARLSANGQWQFQDERATIGSTSLIVRAGAGQGSNNVTTWQNAAGGVIAFVNNVGDFHSGAFINTDGTRTGVYSSGLRLNNIGRVSFSSGTDALATNDATLTRQGPNVIQAGDGGANANGVFRAAQFRSVLTTPASSTAACTEGSQVWDADYIYICTATNNWKRATLNAF